MARHTSDAINLLKDDHREVEELFAQFEKASGGREATAIVRRICNALAVHMTIEEEIFYPALKGKIEADLHDEAYVEHDGAKALITQLANSSASDDFRDAQVMVLKEQIEHHVHEEEMRGGMFSQAKAAGVDLEALGAQMTQRKEQLMNQAGKEPIAPPPPVTMANPSGAMPHAS